MIPILFYHRADDWEVKSWQDYLDGWDEVYAPFTPPGGYIFIPLQGMTDEEIKNFRYGFLVTSLLLMKHRLERDYLLNNLHEIFNFVEADPSESNIDNRIENLKYALHYLQAIQVIRWNEAKRHLRSLKLSYRIMTVLEEVKLEGFQEGMEKGMDTGIQKATYLNICSMLKKKLRDWIDCRRH